MVHYGSVQTLALLKTAVVGVLVGAVRNPWLLPPVAMTPM